MQHFAHTAVRSERAASIYAAVGGVETFFRLAHAMHARMQADVLLGPRFARVSAAHVPHLAMWLVEVFGGPKLYTETLGDIGPMLAAHANLTITEDERARFVELACDAAKAVFPAHSAAALTPFRSYVEWGSRVAVSNAQRGHVANPAAGVPRWRSDDA